MPGSQTMVESKVEFRWMDFVCPLTFLVAFLASAPWGRKAWSMVDCCATFTFGAGLVFIPQVVLGFQVTGKLDLAHLFLARHVGALLLGSAVTWFLCRKSNDTRMFCGLFYSRVFSCSLLLVAQAYSAYHLWNRKGLHFNDKYLMFACGGVGFWLLGSVVQLFRYRDIGGYSRQSNGLSGGLWFDHFVLLLVGILAFAFPSQMLRLVIKKEKAIIDAVHVSFFRSIAALVIGHALSSHCAAGFFYMADKKAHVIGRMTTQVLALGINIFGHFVLDLFTMYHVTPFMLVGFYVTYLLTLYFRCNQKTSADAPEYSHAVVDEYTTHPATAKAETRETEQGVLGNISGQDDEDYDDDLGEGEETDPGSDLSEGDEVGNRKKTK